MSPLDEYRRKRDFTVTPEPAPGSGPSRAGLCFVVQKHAASRLHWDFRIELDGVLLSWAVPKGPSLDTADKRLAMRVEDHPIEYGSFEGVIPAGEYGGGTVMLWDRGTWEPDHGDPRQHLAEGHLKFYLCGERLRGRWMLVKTKGYGGKSADNSWLLFKERDEEVRGHAEFDATADWTTSVATGRTMEEIAAEVDAVWHSNESVEDNVARTTGLFPPETPDDHSETPPSPGEVVGSVSAPMPSKVDVELATLVERVPEGAQWLHELKFDGYRIVAFLEKGAVKLVSRNHHDWTERFPEVTTAIAALPASQAVLDGEVVVVSPDGTNDFQALQNHARRGVEANLHYMVFDLVYLDGFDLRGSALEDRKALLAALVPRHGDRLRFTDHVEGHGDALFSGACDFSLEGVVSKRRSAPYRSGRGRDWLKTKCLLRQEFVVVGYTDPQGSRIGFGALLLAVNAAEGLASAGRVGTGFDEQSLRDIHARLVLLERAEPPLASAPTGASARGVHWVEPSLVAEVAFAEWTEDGALRHPSFIGLRDDKEASAVTVERPVEVAPPTEPDAAGQASPARAAASEPSVAGVALTNPDRVLWPDVGTTKLDLARYYESVAELMLPHVANRPLSLVRCPGGMAGECFYQKHIENFPKSVRTVDVYEPGDDETVPYAKVTDLAGLVGLVQMGVLEIHPWGSRADDIDKPDRLVFDLDPDTALPWSTVTTTALLLRSELGRLGLTSWLKTTGGKGLHIVVPIVRRQEWNEAREFARAFVDHIVKMEPRLFTASMSKGQRNRKIFIDYVRNTRGATSVAAYSTRARPGAPVSMPLFWDEIEGNAERPEFTVLTTRDRLARLSVDPWAELPSKRQSITRDARSRLGLP